VPSPESRREAGLSPELSTCFTALHEDGRDIEAVQDIADICAANGRTSAIACHGEKRYELLCTFELFADSLRAL